MIEDLRGTNNWTPGGRKYDNGKPPLSWIPRRANEEEAKVLASGAAKYARWNWAEGMAWSRLLDAAMRHIGAYADGENLDGETGLSHLAHARCCLGFLLDYEVEHPELDDRRPRTNMSSLRPPLADEAMQGGLSQLSLFTKL